MTLIILQASYILFFHRSYILSFQGYDTNIHLNPIYFMVFRSLLKKTVMAWLILSFQGTYVYFHLKLIYKFFGVKKLKMYQGQYVLTHIVPSKILYKFLLEPLTFYHVKRLIEKLYQGQYVLITIVLFNDQGLILFFLFQRSWRNSNHGQFSAWPKLVI